MELDYPIQSHGQTVSTLTLSRPDVGSLEGLEMIIDKHGNKRFDLGMLVGPIARMAGIPPSAAKTITISDLVKHGGELLDFLGLTFLMTGEDE